MLLAALAWVIRAGWWEVLRLGSLEGPELAIGASRSVLGLASVLAVVLAVLGLADYGLCYCRFESMLRTTPEEQREDQRVLEGDVPARAQRRRIARAWRGDSPELLAGASLVIHGTGGLTVILSGGPPPRRVLIRAAARTADGLRLRRSAEAAKIPHVEDAELARDWPSTPPGTPAPRRTHRRARRDLADPGRGLSALCPRCYARCSRTFKGSSGSGTGTALIPSRAFSRSASRLAVAGSRASIASSA